MMECHPALAFSCAPAGFNTRQLNEMCDKTFGAYGEYGYDVANNDELYQTVFEGSGAAYGDVQGDSTGLLIAPPSAYPQDGTGGYGYTAYNGEYVRAPADFHGGVRDPVRLRERALTAFTSKANLRRLSERLGRPVTAQEVASFLPQAGDVLDDDPYARRAWLAGRGGAGYPGCYSGSTAGAAATVEGDERAVFLARARNDPERPFVGRRKTEAAKTRRYWGEELDRAEDRDWWNLGEN